jgi:hypothetical protein
MTTGHEQPRRRFAPVPIETTFSSVRKGGELEQLRRVGPVGELTPDASPRSPSPVPRELREHRRFAPQLIETSRRARRVGDSGPATRPTDKTDITPYTKNIYTAKHKARRRQGSNGRDHDDDQHHPPTRRESEDDTVKGYLLEIAAREAEKQIQEAALAVFPNSRPREGGVAHFYFRESSGSDKSPESTSPPLQGQQQPRGRARIRRKSSDLGLNWWHKHMQDHVKQLVVDKGEEGDDEVDEAVSSDDFLMRTDSELDRMDLAVPPDALWTTTNRTPAQKDSMDELPAAGALPMLGRDTFDSDMLEMAPPLQQSSAPAGYSGPGRAHAAFEPGPDARVEARIEQMRKAVSPPMLGRDLSFRQCPSPKWTKLEPMHSFLETPEVAEDKGRTQRSGLWRGYCYKAYVAASEGQEAASGGIHRPQMLVTPHPGSPEDDSGNDNSGSSITEEPVSSLHSLKDAVLEARPRGGGTAVKGLQMLTGLDQKLQREKAEMERLEKISQEFNDGFVTQVYNYLSLGYPAVAWMFDEELSKISGMSIFDLRANDAADAANGHIVEMRLDDKPRQYRCPRWRALQMYIIEWAKQHPDLGNMQPVAWGVTERRGSWAI